MIKFKRKREEHKTEFLCSHESLCYIPCYQFNNPYIKLCKSRGDFFQLNILEFQTRYYSIPSDSCYPILINKAPTFRFDSISNSEIWNILHGNRVEKPFMVVLYSTPSYVRTQHTNVISQNIIGVLENNSTEMLHLFIIPHLNDPGFDVYQLEGWSQDRELFNQKNFFSCNHPTEGNPIFKSPYQINKNLLNQDNCVCDHPDTDRYFAPTKRVFKPLGKQKKLTSLVQHSLILTFVFFFSASGANPKNFLYENLGESHLVSYFFLLLKFFLLLNFLFSFRGMRFSYRIAQDQIENMQRSFISQVKKTKNNPPISPHHSKIF